VFLPHPSPQAQTVRFRQAHSCERTHPYLLQVHRSCFFPLLGYTEVSGLTARSVLKNSAELQCFRRIVFRVSCTISICTQKINVNFFETFSDPARCFCIAGGGCDRAVLLPHPCKCLDREAPKEIPEPRKLISRKQSVACTTGVARSLEVGTNRDEKTGSAVCCDYWEPIALYLPPPEARVSATLHPVRSANHSSVDAIERVFQPIRGGRTGVGVMVAKGAVPDSPLQKLT